MPSCGVPPGASLAPNLAPNIESEEDAMKKETRQLVAHVVG
jgi:hypothetical protein